MERPKKQARKIKKAILPVAGLGTRFLPLSKVLPKELLPVVDKPTIQYIVEGVRDSGISKVIFVINSKDKIILDYFKESQELKNILKKRKKTKTLEMLENFHEKFEDISFSHVLQRKPLGDGHAVLQAKKEIKNEPVAVSFGDDIVDGDDPALEQLMRVFETCNSPVIALKRVPRERVSSYGAVKVEKIANRLYKIKKIVEKPEPDQAPSDLVIVGKYILTPEVFDYLKNASPSKRGEIILADTLDKMTEDGKIIYGYEIKGNWLECGDKLKWLRTFLYFVLKDPRFGEDLKKYLKEIK